MQACRLVGEVRVSNDTISALLRVCRSEVGWWLKHLHNPVVHLALGLQLRIAWEGARRLATHLWTVAHLHSSRTCHRGLLLCYMISTPGPRIASCYTPVDSVLERLVAHHALRVRLQVVRTFDTLVKQLGTKRTHRGRAPHREAVNLL